MHITIISKAPEAGKSKTRLCPACTPEQAAAVATAGLIDTIAAVSQVAARTGAEPVLLLDGDIQTWMPTNYRVIAQRGNGLEERLCNGFLDLGPGVIIGMETPHVAGELADAVRAASRGTDSMGLATDGGYWMIGLCETSANRAAKIFTGVPMSTSYTGLAQLQRLHGLGCRVRLLPIARDLDTIDDLRAVANSDRSGELADLARVLLR